jgi:serine protease Do
MDSIDQSQNQKKKQIKSGVISFLVFLAFIVLIQWSYHPPKFSKFVSGFLSLHKDDDVSSPSYVTQEVVEEESSVISVVDRVSPAVVSIVVETFAFDPWTGPIESEEGIGTGFIVEESGLIVTNSHVVDSIQGDYSVVLKDGSTYEVTKIHVDSNSDLAIIEINARNLPTVDLGDSSVLKVGQTAIAIGNALGRFQNTVTVGVVSGIARQFSASGGFGTPSKTYEEAIQTDAALNPGNSGGPLLNSSGQVIGINVATTYGADNISFAVPVNTLKPLLKSFLEKGRIVRAFLGVEYTMITKDIAKLRDFPEGAFIARVVPGSPAARAGIKRGDIIIELDDKAVDADNSIGKYVSQKSVGDEIKVLIDRDSEILSLTIELAEMPEGF